MICVSVFLYETYFRTPKTTPQIELDTPTQRSCLKCSQSFQMYKNSRMKSSDLVLVGCLVCGSREWIPRKEADTPSLQMPESLFPTPLKKGQ